MMSLKTLALAGGTVCCALGIGYVMQTDAAERGHHAQIQLSSIADTSSAVSAPRLPLDLKPLRTPVEQVALSVDEPEISLRAPVVAQPRVTQCETSVSARAMAGAMVALTITAPCNAQDRVTIHHQGMMFTETLSDTGELLTKIPALDQNAQFVVSFANGTQSMAQAEVPSLTFYERVVIQWRGDAGLELHAREFGADYFENGHVWHGTAGNLAATAMGQGGFMMRLGHDKGPQARQAEVYSFPTATIKRNGNVLMTVEAEVTPRNCSQQVEAQTLELDNRNGLRVRDLTVEIPGCGSTGDFLVLKNLVEDLTIVAR